MFVIFVTWCDITLAARYKLFTIKFNDVFSVSFNLSSKSFPSPARLINSYVCNAIFN